MILSDYIYWATEVFEVGAEVLQFWAPKIIFHFNEDLSPALLYRKHNTEMEAVFVSQFMLSETKDVENLKEHEIIVINS